MNDEFKTLGKPGVPLQRRRVFGVAQPVDPEEDSIEKLYQDQLAKQSLEKSKAKKRKPLKEFKLKSPVMARNPLRLSKKRVLIGVLVIGLVVTSFSIVRRAQIDNKPAQVAVDDETKKAINTLTTGVLGASTVTNSTPTFDTLKPGADASVGLQFDKNKGVAVFKDKVGNTEISISQQPYPDALKSNQSGIESLAKSLNGYVSFETTPTDKGTAYIVRKKDQSQTVILGSGEVLLFINSPIELSTEKWASYINSLQ
jgi:hypothetical protein